MDEVKIGPFLVTRDRETDALYIYFKPELRDIRGTVVETIESNHPGINIDFMDGGIPFGVEIYALFNRRSEGQ